MRVSSTSLLSGSAPSDEGPAFWSEDELADEEATTEASLVPFNSELAQLDAQLKEKALKAAR